MADVKKVATRESYGNALAECGADFPDLVVRRLFLTDISTAVLQSVI